MIETRPIPDTETGSDPETLKLLLQIYKGTSQIMQPVIARELLKED